jgi:flagellar basal-body rod protein FlgG
MQAELYTSAQGLIARQLELDVVSNNLANANTTGYREISPFFRTFNAAIEDGPQNPLNGAANNQPVATGVFMHDKSGSIKNTDNPFDMAIQGEGYFKVRTNDDIIRYTRSGAFTLNQAGELTTQKGYRVLDTQEQPIVLNRQAGLTEFGTNGQVVQDGQIIAQIALVTFEDKTTLAPEEDTLVANLNPNAQEVAANGQIMSRHLENSNVNVAEQMISLINAQRAYEANTRVIRTIDQSNSGSIQTYTPR